MTHLSFLQIWLIVAALTLIIELMSVSFVLVFFTIGALVTALTSWVGLTPSLVPQLLLFSVVSVGSLVFLRKPFQLLFKKNGKTVEYTEYIGDSATVIETIAAEGEGKVFFRGTEWIAVSEQNTEIKEGSKVVIKQLDGIRLIVAS